MTTNLVKAIALTCTLAAMTACSGSGGGENAAAACEIEGSSYGIIQGETLSSGNALSKSTVMVIHIQDDNHAEICTGTLIDSDKVLTAAHCTSRSSSEKTLVAFSNSFGCVTKSQTNAKQLARPVVAKEINSSYSYARNKSVDNATNDLAVLKFSGGMAKGYSVRPLPTSSYDPATATEIVMSGYGITDEKNEDSGTLRFTRANPSRLKKEFYMRGLKKTIQVDKTLIMEQPENGVCSGDSGGPLYAKNQDGTLTLIGVTSMVADNNAEYSWNAKVCHGVSIFVDVRAQLDWIQRAVQSLNY